MTRPDDAFSRFAPPTVERADGGYWRVKNAPSPRELSDYYAERYYQEGRGSYETAYSDAELRHIRAKIALRWRLAAGRFDAPGRLLDVGCGEGFVLAHGLQAGWTVAGLDFSSAGAKAQNPDILPYLRAGDLFASLADEIECGAGYEVIWLQNVLEHVIDPIKLLHDLHRLITPAGVLVVTVPNDFSRLQHEALETGRIDQAFWVALPDHLSYFGPDSLRKVGGMTGWSCERLIGDFPVDWFLFNADSNYVADRSKGKAAHHARVALETLILDADPDDATAFFSGLARIGMGRDLTAFFTPVE